ncbi:MAG: cell division protein FtsW [Solirubrobacteraceae bacterium]|jgi:cell division protein FtsW|nr:cell division protein FtsW [Solirubrobacteraceae bacterium]MEA2276856.1 cell division protein FtsW [Solirubrobacteraceae bacterium]MEA2393329.1 cell division protein FtsW [Solirubrobacteraceae bacterium]
MRAAAAARARVKPKPPLEYNILLTATLCLLALGAVMVYSASSARTLLQGQGEGTTYLVRYVVYGAIGFVALHVIARRGLDVVVRLTGPLLGFAFFCLVAVKLPGLGVEVNGARRWLGAGPLIFQPSEMAKLALVLYAAKFLATKPGRLRSPRSVTPLLLVGGTMLLLVASQPDLGTALVIAFTLTALLVAAGLPVRYLLIGAGILAFLVSVYAISEPYRRARLTTFLDPWSHAGGAGFQAVQGQIALGSGGLFGRGIGQSVQKIFYLPEAHTDFILAIIGEELGVAGVFVVLFLYGMIAYAGLRVAKAARGAYAKLLAAGVTSLILSQASLNVFAVLGLAPLTGVPLPFISYGATNLTVLLAGMGLLLNVAAGGSARLRVVEGSRRHGADDRDRGRRDSGARGAGAGRRRRTAG